MEISARIEDSPGTSAQGLYDFAPIVGYFTLTHTGGIQDVNLTGASVSVLGMPRPKLIGRGFRVPFRDG